MKIFDTHVHYNSEKLMQTFNETIQKHTQFFSNNVGTTLENSKLALSQAKQYDRVYCSIGIHPLEINDHDEEEVLQEFNKFLKSNKKIIAIGETGLDFHRVSKEQYFPVQRKWLLMQAKLAKQFDLPLVLHIRNAHKEIIYLLKNTIPWRGIIHCFDGEIEDLFEYLKLDTWFISISPLAFRNPGKFRRVVEITPMEKLLIESDAPFLIQEPWLIEKTINFIAEIKQLTAEEVRRILWLNSVKAFNLNLDNNGKQQ